jgi:murein DD-endopeptidase MepM/ murein hydrolase activator NlpD
LANYYVYGRTVRAPAAGTVRSESNAMPDSPIGTTRAVSNSCGNHVVIEVAPDEFLFLCHLQPGSIAVRAGDRVGARQPVGRVGNSGKSTEPHLHLHLQTTPHHDLGEGIPLYFHDYLENGRVIQRGMPTGGRRRQVILAPR